MKIIVRGDLVTQDQGHKSFARHNLAFLVLLVIGVLFAILGFEALSLS